MFFMLPFMFMFLLRSCGTLWRSPSLAIVILIGDADFRGEARDANECSLVRCFRRKLAADHAKRVCIFYFKEAARISLASLFKVPNCAFEHLHIELSGDILIESRADTLGVSHLTEYTSVGRCDTLNCKG